MRIVPDYRHMPLEDGSSMDEITERRKGKEHRPEREMTAEEMLEMADQMENRTFKGHINLAMSWEDTIEDLRRQAYELLDNN